MHNYINNYEHILVRNTILRMIYILVSTADADENVFYVFIHVFIHVRLSQTCGPNSRGRGTRPYLGKGGRHKDQKMRGKSGVTRVKKF